MLLARLLKQVVKTGSLTMIDAGGATHHFGEGDFENAVTFRLHEPRLARRLYFRSHLALGESYTDGTLTIENGDIYDFLDLVTRNLGVIDHLPLDGLRDQIGQLVRRLQQYNPLRRAGKNVHHHYDLSGTLYDLFLDRDRQYSCAYFTAPDMSLEDAQEAKKQHLAAKLLIKDGQKILDIGSGWGGMGLFLAQSENVNVTGVTLSTEQHGVSQHRAAKAGLADRVRFDLRDYRQVDGKFDRIVSVGMFEHVGQPQFETYFRCCARLMKEDGVALIHTIGRMGKPGTTDAFTRKYIFPGGYIPALSETVAASEKVRLIASDVETLRLHYALTLREWYRRCLDHKDEIVAMYDERFFRMWTFYLSGATAAFESGGMCNFQIQYVRSRQALPMHRDYMAEAERSIMADENAPVHKTALSSA